MGQIILGRPWLFDKNITIYGQSNMCQYLHNDKKIKLLPLRPKFRQPEQTPTTLKKTKRTNLIGAKVIDQKLKKGTLSFLTLALLPTPPSLPPIANRSLPPIDLACSDRQPLPPLLSTPHHSRILGSASSFASHTRVLHEKIRDEIMNLMLILKLILIFIVE